MANRGPDTNGAQIFITYGKQTTLDGKYTVIGRVVDGFETLDKIEMVEVDKKNRPKEPIKVLNTVIHANPLAQ